MANVETPSSVMYSILKQLKLSNKEAASLLLSDTQMHGGQLLMDRIEERTFLFRLTHGNPGEYPESYFANLSNVAQTLCARAVRNGSSVSSMVDLAEHLSGQPLADMEAACKEAGLDGSLFSNLVKSTKEHPGLSEANRASAIMLAYIAVGCLGDSARATELVNGFLASTASRGFQTELANESAYSESPKSEDIKIALVRVIDGALDLNSMHVLNTDEDGTVIGSMATDSSSINDVGPLVSKKHVRVYRDNAGAWWAQGLGSTNGTKLIDGADKHEVVVEAPKAERGGASSKPVPLHVGDALHLAGTTVFLTIQVA